MTIPDPGQLVEVRQRRFVVTDVLKSALPEDPLSQVQNGVQHLISLSSIEDDGLGEELRVVWELEPGARVHEKMALPEPTGFDPPQRLDAFLDAVRWGAVSSADVRALQSPFRSGIEIEDYQLDPVVRALQMPRVNLLIADDVGLGKTVEAGLVIQELILRHRARTILVVCPASLQIHWHDQMGDRFGLEFRIVDSALMKELRRRRGLHVNPWKHFPRLITSIDFLKRERPMQLFREVLPAQGEPAFPRRFDVLIVDEAHNVAPQGGVRYATDSLRTAAIRSLAPHFEHNLFLTATPHNGYPESFSSLLELLDNQRFARGVRPDRGQLRTVMVRRLKSELPPRWDGSPRFPHRKLEPLEVSYTEQERQAHRALRRYTKLRQASGDQTERFATEFVLKLLKKRMFSSPAAFAATLNQHVSTLRSVRKPVRLSKVKPSANVLRRYLEGMEEESADDDAYESLAGTAVGTATELFRQLGSEERKLLSELERFATSTAARADSKAERLLRWLNDHLRPSGKWNKGRVLIFTEYRATQKWLQGLLAAEGMAKGERLMTLYGGMPTDDRERIKAAFQTDPEDSPVRILLATDAASEGIDLQNHCSRLIHYEIPWNPNRLEQRNGRIDRHGQKASEVRVYHFVGEGYDKLATATARPPGELEGDLEFLMHAARKVEKIREDLGKVGPVIVAQVEEAMLGRRTRLDTAVAEREAKGMRGTLRFERKLREEIARLRTRLDESRRELRLSPENVQSVVEIGLELAGQPPLQQAAVTGIWPDPTGKRKRCPVFHLPALRDSWARCSQGLAHPHTGKIRPIVFDHALAAGRDDVVLVHLNHRLVQMCLRLLRAEVWSPEGQKRLHRVTARLVPDTALKTPAVVAHARLVVLGGDNHRLHEEVIVAGGLLRQGRFVRLNVGQTAAALRAALPDEVPKEMKRRLAGLWPSHSGALMQALEARMRDRTSGLHKAISERAEKEAKDITAVLEELERNIRAELSQAEPAQLELWAAPEREQFERNKESLRARVARIPDEVEREIAAVRDRYADPVPRLFPVAVTYLVPEKLAISRGAAK